jgi:hypothetical protein
MKEKEVENYHCGSCKYFKVDADRSESTCKRIDHKTIQFSVPWFKSYDCGQFSGIICSDFIPADWCINAVKEWRGFEEYWYNYIKQWLPYSNTNTYISFIINGDKNIRYHVKLMDFVYGTMFDNNKLKAYEKVYYKKNKKSSIGFELIIEPIMNGIIVLGLNKT